eukprot:m51a1_g5885 hypothetical protein (283) ;mRNA; r:518409-519913
MAEPETPSKAFENLVQQLQPILRSTGAAGQAPLPPAEEHGQQIVEMLLGDEPPRVEALVDLARRDAAAPRRVLLEHLQRVVGDPAQPLERRLLAARALVEYTSAPPGGLGVLLGCGPALLDGVVAAPALFVASAPVASAVLRLVGADDKQRVTESLAALLGAMSSPAPQGATELGGRALEPQASLVLAEAALTHALALSQEAAQGVLDALQRCRLLVWGATCLRAPAVAPEALEAAQRVDAAFVVLCTGAAPHPLAAQWSAARQPLPAPTPSPDKPSTPRPK